MATHFIPSREADLVTWSTNFNTLIVATPTAFGLVAGQATTYTGLHTAFVDAYQAAKDPGTRTPASIVTKNDARRALVANARLLARIIQATPSVTDTQRAELGLSVRGEPAPVGNPGTPTDFRVGLLGDGSLDLKWKCKNPAGCTNVVYQVWRRLGGTGALAYLGGVGQRKFVDTTIPPGASLLTYQIQAVRSTGVGGWATFNVSFGPVTESMPAGTVNVNATPKLAA